MGRYGIVVYCMGSYTKGLEFETNRKKSKFFSNKISAPSNRSANVSMEFDGI